MKTYDNSAIHFMEGVKVIKKITIIILLMLCY